MGYFADKTAGGTSDRSKTLSAFGAFFLVPWYFGAAVLAKKAGLGHLAIYRFWTALRFRAGGTRDTFALRFFGFCGFNGTPALIGSVKTAALENDTGSAVYQTVKLLLAALRASFQRIVFYVLKSVKIMTAAFALVSVCRHINLNIP
jgi:hypothetical protein